ncbi:hypothetical protein BX666DRAFT_1975973 [Dichotomocladium elegans]|nr:hypothetical protein BX666DRAFT_1975973 [Dichotomocladium elegans]
MRKAKAIYDCTADGDGELSFKEGDILINVTESAEDGWYVGRIEGTVQEGLFPYNYVEFITESEVASKFISESQQDQQRRRWRQQQQQQQQQQQEQRNSGHQSSLSSPWCIISAKGNTQEEGAKTAAVNTQAAAVSRSTTAAAEKPPPTLAPKPQFKNTIEVSALKNGPSSAIKPSTGYYRSPTRNQEEEEGEEDEDGFQIVSLPLYSQRKAELGSVDPSSPSKAPMADGQTDHRKNNSIFSDLRLAASNPAPPLPSKPIANNRRARSTKPAFAAPLPHQAKQSTESAANAAPSTPALSLPPVIKQKPSPVAIAQKGHSTPNNSPPPLRPKPSFGKQVATEHSGFGAPTTTTMGSRQLDAPSHGALSSMAPVALPGLSSSPLGGRPPRTLYSNACSSSAGHQPAAGILHSSKAIPLPGLATSKSVTQRPPFTSTRSTPRTLTSDASSPLSSSDPPDYVSVASRLEQWQQRSRQETVSSSSSRPKYCKVSSSSGGSETTMDASTKRTSASPESTATAAAAPAAAAAAVAAAQDISRYEDLFDKIQDDGVVDAQTVKLIWERSRVSDEALSRIWKRCDPQGHGKLDKAGFIQGLREIDALLAQNDKVSSV